MTKAYRFVLFLYATELTRLVSVLALVSLCSGLINKPDYYSTSTTTVFCRQSAVAFMHALCHCSSGDEQQITAKIHTSVRVHAFIGQCHHIIHHHISSSSSSSLSLVELMAHFFLSNQEVLLHL